MTAGPSTKVNGLPPCAISRPPSTRVIVRTHFRSFLKYSPVRDLFRRVMRKTSPSHAPACDTACLGWRKRRRRCNARFVCAARTARCGLSSPVRVEFHDQPRGEVLGTRYLESRASRHRPLLDGRAERRALRPCAALNHPRPRRTGLAPRQRTGTLGQSCHGLSRPWAAAPRPPSRHRQRRTSGPRRRATGSAAGFALPNGGPRRSTPRPQREACPRRGEGFVAAIHTGVCERIRAHKCVLLVRG